MASWSPGCLSPSAPTQPSGWASRTIESEGHRLGGAGPGRAGVSVTLSSRSHRARVLFSRLERSVHSEHLA